MLAAVERLDWPAVATWLAGWEEREPASAAAALDMLSERADVPDLIGAHLADPLARLLGLRWMITAAWQVGAGSDVLTAEQLADFRLRLEEAERELVEAAAADPSDPLVASYRIVTATGLGLGLSEIQRRYARLAVADPRHVPGQRAMVQALSPQGSGTTELMIDFASGCLDAAPPGSRAGLVVADALMEQWRELGGGEAGRAWLLQPEPVALLERAAASSVLHPDYEPGLTWVADHSMFAALTSLAGWSEAAAKHFRALNGFADERAWRYLESPEAAYRDHVGAAVGWAR